MHRLLPVLLLVIFCSSCIVQAPKYTHVEQVLELKPGMSQEEVSQKLGIPPYDIRYKNDSLQVLVYKYRVTDRKTVPLFKKETNGMKVSGAYVDLLVKYDAAGKMVSFETCSKCSETNEKTTVVDFDKLITLITVTLPALLVYLGFTTTQ